MNFSPNMIFLNRSFDKKRLKALLLWFRLNLSEGAALEAVEILQELGFRSATQGAISLGLDDLKTPTSKGGRVFQAQLEVALAHHEHHRGNRTPVELFQHLVDTWHRTSQDLTAEVVQLFHSTERVNPVYMMAFSGARGNLSQVRQLVGMRGLMADPRGQIVGFPILSNFREGLTITEYFVSCYGARKGVVDTAIRTADAGYLTRRLADVSHHFVVRTTNCGTHRNICLRDIKEGQKTILPLASRLVGRVLGEHISFASPSLTLQSRITLSPSFLSSSMKEGDVKGETGRSNVSKQNDVNKDNPIAYRNQEITADLASKLASQCLEVAVRSPLSCSLRWGVCQLCYGWGLSEGRRVTLGEAVGIIAAQSIGEPGTQLTLRTFHTGGVFSGDLLNEIRAPYGGTIFFPEPLQGLLIRTPHGQIAFLTKVSGKMVFLRSPKETTTADFVNTGKSTPLIIPKNKSLSFRTNQRLSPSFAPLSFTQGDENDIDLKSKENYNQDQELTKENNYSYKINKADSFTSPSFIEDDKNEGDASVKVSLLAVQKDSEEKDSPNYSEKKASFEQRNLLKENTKHAVSLQSNTETKEFPLQPSTVIFVRQKEQVNHNQLLAEFSSSTLQPINDQIEVTQQVLSETAGQVWFKEIQYGNRKGPGSGSLGTHFSSQKLGGIWVLAGKPRSEILLNDRQRFPIRFDRDSTNFCDLKKRKQQYDRSLSLFALPSLTEGDDTLLRNVKNGNDKVIHNFFLSNFASPKIHASKMQSQSSLQQKQLKSFKISEINLYHDDYFLTYHYSLGYSQLINFASSKENRITSIYFKERDTMISEGDHCQQSTNCALINTSWNIEIGSGWRPRLILSKQKRGIFEKKKNIFLLPPSTSICCDKLALPPHRLIGTCKKLIRFLQPPVISTKSITFLKIPRSYTWLPSSTPKTKETKHQVIKIPCKSLLRRSNSWQEIYGWRTNRYRSNPIDSIFVNSDQIPREKMESPSLTLQSRIILSPSFLSSSIKEDDVKGETGRSNVLKQGDVNDMSFLRNVIKSKILKEKETTDFKNIFEKETADKVNLLLGTPLKSKVPSATQALRGQEIPVAWWLEKKWKTTSGMLLAEPFFSNKERTEGQLFWLSSNFIQHNESGDEINNQLRNSIYFPNACEMENNLPLYSIFANRQSKEKTKEDGPYKKGANRDVDFFDPFSLITSKTKHKKDYNKNLPFTSPCFDTLDRPVSPFTSPSFIEDDKNEGDKVMRFCNVKEGDAKGSDKGAAVSLQSNFGDQLQELSYLGGQKIYDNLVAFFDDVSFVFDFFSLTRSKRKQKKSNIKSNVSDIKGVNSHYLLSSNVINEMQRSKEGDQAKKFALTYCASEILTGVDKIKDFKENYNQKNHRITLSPPFASPSLTLQSRITLSPSFLSSSMKEGDVKGETGRSNVSKQGDVKGDKSMQKKGINAIVTPRPFRGKGLENVLIFHHSLDFLFETRKSQNVPVIKKLIQTLNLNRRQYSATNRGIFSPLKQNYTFESFIASIDSKVPQLFSTFNAEDSSIERVKKTKNLLTFKSFWQPLSLNNYPNKISNKRDLQGIKNVQPKVCIKKCNTVGNKKLRFVNNFIKRKGTKKTVFVQKPIWLSVHISNNNLSLMNSVDHPCFVNGVNTVTEGIIEGITEGITGGNSRKSKILSTSFINSVDHHLVSPKVMRKKVISQLFLQPGQPVQPVEKVVSAIFYSSTSNIKSNVQKNGQIHNKSRVSTKKRDASKMQRVEKNDSNLDQHVVHTINLPIVSFPYIIPSRCEWFTKDSKKTYYFSRCGTPVQGKLLPLIRQTFWEESFFNPAQMDSALGLMLSILGLDEQKKPGAISKSEFMEILRSSSNSRVNLLTLPNFLQSPLVSTFLNTTFATIIDQVSNDYKYPMTSFSTNFVGDHLTYGKLTQFSSPSFDTLQSNVKESDATSLAQLDRLFTSKIAENSWLLMLTKLTKSHRFFSMIDQVDQKKVIQNKLDINRVNNQNVDDQKIHTNLSKVNRIILKRLNHLETLNKREFIGPNFPLKSSILNPQNLIYLKARGEKHKPIKRLTTSLFNGVKHLKNFTLFSFISSSAVDKQNHFFLRVSDIHFVVSLPIKTITNPQGRYTFAHLKLSKDNVVATSCVDKKYKLNKIPQKLWTRKIQHILFTTHQVLSHKFKGYFKPNVLAPAVPASFDDLYFLFDSVKQKESNVKNNASHVNAVNSHRLVSPFTGGDKVINEMQRSTWLADQILGFNYVDQKTFENKSSLLLKSSILNHKNPQSCCYCLMQRVVEYPVERSSFNRWFTTKRKKLQYSPFSTNLISLFQTEKLHIFLIKALYFNLTNQSKTALINDQVNKVFADKRKNSQNLLFRGAGLINSEVKTAFNLWNQGNVIEDYNKKVVNSVDYKKDLKANSKEELAFLVNHNDTNTLPIRNKIWIASKKFTSFHSAIYLDWYAFPLRPYDLLPAFGSPSFTSLSLTLQNRITLSPSFLSSSMKEGGVKGETGRSNVLKQGDLKPLYKALNTKNQPINYSIFSKSTPTLIHENERRISLINEVKKKRASLLTRTIPYLGESDQITFATNDSALLSHYQENITNASTMQKVTVWQSSLFLNKEYFLRFFEFSKRMATFLRWHSRCDQAIISQSVPNSPRKEVEPSHLINSSPSLTLQSRTTLSPLFLSSSMKKGDVKGETERFNVSNQGDVKGESNSKTVFPFFILHKEVTIKQKKYSSIYTELTKSSKLTFLLNFLFAWKKRSIFQANKKQKTENLIKNSRAIFDAITFPQLRWLLMLTELTKRFGHLNEEKTFFYYQAKLGYGLTSLMDVNGVTSPSFNTLARPVSPFTSPSFIEEDKNEGDKVMRLCNVQKGDGNQGDTVAFKDKENNSKGKSSYLFPGQLVVYGEKIDQNIATTESGQILYVDSQRATLRKAQTVLIYSQAILSVLSGEWIKKGTPLMALSYQKLVTGDIVQGLPKIEQFFEAPLLRDGTFWSDSLQAKLNLFFQEHREKLPLAEAVRKGFSDIQRVLVEGVQRVYISQGVLIADKHLEVIVRQMTCKGRILYSGDTGFLRNELVALDKIESVNQVTYGQKALYHPQVRGITDASLESESFLSAASFQETTRVLSRDSVIGKTDLMRGLKERVIVGELIQAGTGLANNSVYNFLLD